MNEFGIQTADQASAALARITFHGAKIATAALKNANVVFEAAPEVLDIKRRALRMIGEVARAKAVVSSTTSTMMVDELAVYIT